jgi:hypothetical protein
MRSARHGAQHKQLGIRTHGQIGTSSCGRCGGDCVVVTIWTDNAAVDTLETSPRYHDTVARITAAGFLVGRSEVDRSELHGDVTL